MSTLVYGSILFISAFLLSFIQPLIAKVFLPILGGSPSVWQTCMVFFQGSVLIGYLYAHLITKKCLLKTQVIIHAVLLTLGLFLLPFAITEITPPATDINLILWLLKELLLVIFIPTFIICTSAPLLQRWFTHTRHHFAHDPYYLYAASNAGSLIALCLYPFLIEPLIGVKQQNISWAIGYGLFFCLLIGLLFQVYKDEYIHSQANAKSDAAPVTWAMRCQWLLLAFTPSSLFIGLTTTITTDIAAVPLFWVIPLALYIATYILCFSQKPLFPHRYVTNNQVFLYLPLMVMLPFSSRFGPMTMIEAHLIAFFGCALYCHGQLYQQRPHKQHLTEFYLFIAIGGLCGGLLNSIIAPSLLPDLYEYPFMLSFAYALRAWNKHLDVKWTDFILPGIMAMLLFFTYRYHLSLVAFSPNHFNTLLALIYIFLLIILFINNHRALSFACGILLLFYAHAKLFNNHADVLYQRRNFFGVIKVIDNPLLKVRTLLHGTTMHGMQSYGKDAKPEYTYYYPLKELANMLNQNGYKPNAAIIGMGTATIGCVLKTSAKFHFYEIDPDIIEVARNPKYFSYLRDCPPEGGITLGDGRISLRKAAANTYDLIIIDAFSSDSIPTHLVNLEATRLYFEKSRPNALIAFHISNRYLNLTPVLARLAQKLHVAIFQLDYAPPKNAPFNSHFSKWVILTQRSDWESQLSQAGWQRVYPDKLSVLPLWTDDFSNILSVLK